MAANPFGSTFLSIDVNILKTLNTTVNSTNGAYSDIVFTTVCGDNLSKCINSYMSLCKNLSTLFDQIRAPSYS